MSRRTEKVESLIQQEVGRFILELELPSLTTISKVQVSPDLKWSRLWVTIMDTPDKQDLVLERLNSSAQHFQHELRGKLSMKFVPNLNFVVDHGEEYASHINELIRKIK